MVRLGALDRQNGQRRSLVVGGDNPYQNIYTISFHASNWPTSLATRRELQGNSLIGSLPKEWSELSKLETFDSYGNNITGSLPPEWRFVPPHSNGPPILGY